MIEIYRKIITIVISVIFLCGCSGTIKYPCKPDVKINLAESIKDKFPAIEVEVFNNCAFNDYYVFEEEHFSFLMNDGGFQVVYPSVIVGDYKIFKPRIFSIILKQYKLEHGAVKKFSSIIEPNFYIQMKKTKPNYIKIGILILNSRFREDENFDTYEKFNTLINVKGVWLTKNLDMRNYWKGGNGKGARPRK